jgi:voltage-gated potassium channel
MRNSSFRRIITGIVFFSLAVMVAVLGYIMAGWGLLDAVYMVVITVFGVGFDDPGARRTAFYRKKAALGRG